MSRRDLGTDDTRVRVRPGRGSRPRTKQRPRHDDAMPATVTTVDRGRYRLLLDTGQMVIGVKARELNRQRISVAVGDRVDVVGDTSGAPGTLARMVRVHDRSTVLRRSAEDGDFTGHERIIVANADQLCVVTALADPPPRHGMIDRMLVAAYDAGMSPLLVLTKADLADPSELLTHYRDLDVPSVAVAFADGVDQLYERLDGRTSVLVGHSGVGKSTVVNHLIPEAEREVGYVNAVTGRGRHTSSSAVALALPTSGWVIDTPGVRSFGLAHVSAQSIVDTFEDLAEVTTFCQPGCTHEAGLPDCALDTWLAGDLDTSGYPEVDIAAPKPRDEGRVASLRRLIHSVTSTAT